MFSLIDIYIRAELILLIVRISGAIGPTRGITILFRRIPRKEPTASVLLTIYDSAERPRTPGAVPLLEILKKFRNSVSKNKHCDQINNEILDSLPGNETTYLSIASIISEEDSSAIYPTEFLQQSPSRLEQSPSRLVMRERDGRGAD